MDDFDAMFRGRASSDGRVKVFDWSKAEKLLASRGWPDADAGLSGDMRWTSGSIFRNGKRVLKDDAYVYLASNWATPVIVIGGEQIPCWVWRDESPGWDSDTYWPVLSDGEAQQ